TPDALLIDIGLPGMDGYELATVLRQRDNARDALCIAVSGFKRRPIGEGDPFDRYFNKPIDVPALLALLDEAPDNCAANDVGPSLPAPALVRMTLCPLLGQEAWAMSIDSGGRLQVGPRGKTACGALRCR